MVLFLAGIGIIAASVLGGAGPVFAHANLLFSTPAANSTIPVAPTELSLVFDEPVTIDKTPITLAGPHGAVAVAAAVLRSGGTSVNVTVPSGEGRGIYTVHWQVTAEDGDVVAGSYPFAVGPAAAALSGVSAVDTRGAWETGLLRGLLFAALAFSLGELGGWWLLRRIPNAPTPARSWLPWAPLLGVAASLGLALLLLGNGSLIDGILDPAFGALASRPGIVAVAEIIGFALAAIISWTRRPAWAALPLAAVVGGEVFRAHPGIANPILGCP
ncbi:MAG: copper resistance protein CopC [Microbacteriaceae bacterium]|nr:MAG: copper resistance protein CopC [Microbacteriaceae bacterium]